MSSVNWHEVPFIRICLPFVAGIVTQQSIAGIWPLTISLSMSALLTVCICFDKVRNFRQHMRTGILLTLLFAAGAFARNSAEPAQDNILYLSSYHGSISATVCNTEFTEYGSKAKLRIITPAIPGPDITIIAYLKENSTTKLPGDTLIFQDGLDVIPSPANPYAFDVARYYGNQGIYLRTFLDSTRIIAHHAFQGGFHIMRKSAQIRETVKRIYRKYLHNTQSLAVLQAMTIGIKGELNNEIQEAYAKSGAIHVLSISGLHVGIVSFLLFVLVGRARASDRGLLKFSKAIILLSGIWAFACIAGLSPSITRAAFMFSIYLTGAIIRRPVKSLNVLACTAFICLCADPLQVNSVSFQFSYLALFGIVIFFKPLYRLVSIQSFAGKFIWGTIVMSLTAQVFLFPLLVHYFQQVSLLSPLSSLIAIPAAYAILSGGVLILLLHYTIPALATIVGQGMDAGIDMVNTAIIKLSELPISHISDVYLSPAEVAALGGIILLLTMRILTQSRQWTFSAVLGAALLGCVHVQSLWQARYGEVLAIYPNKQLAIDFISGRTCYTTFDIDSMSAFQSGEVAAFRNQSRLRRMSMVYDVSFNRTNDVQVIDLAGAGTDTSFCPDYRIAILTKSDFALLSADLIALHANWLILSSGLSPAMRRASEDFCMQHNQAFHDMRKNGTFYLKKQENHITNEEIWQHLSG